MPERLEMKTDEPKTRSDRHLFSGVSVTSYSLS